MQFIPEFGGDVIIGFPQMCEWRLTVSLKKESEVRVTRSTKARMAKLTMARVAKGVEAPVQPKMS